MKSKKNFITFDPFSFPIHTAACAGEVGPQGPAGPQGQPNKAYLVKQDYVKR